MLYLYYSTTQECWEWHRYKVYRIRNIHNIHKYIQVCKFMKIILNTKCILEYS